MPQSQSTLRSSASTARATKKFHPDQLGARRLRALYGDALVCVRYRDDVARNKRYTTVELIVAERTPPPRRSGKVVAVRIGYDETGLRTRVKSAGGQWDPKRKLWRIDQSLAKQLGLQKRIVVEGPEHA